MGKMSDEWVGWAVYILGLGIVFFPTNTFVSLLGSGFPIAFLRDHVVFGATLMIIGSVSAWFMKEGD